MVASTEAAHKMTSQDIEVNIRSDGSVLIKEVRQVDLSEGTENYIVIDNLGQSKIKNFTVTENGQAYKFIDNWDIDASREDKVNQNGLIKTDNGYELVWGIGEYGEHEYILEYVITDFVKALTDAQMLFWQFVNPGTNIPPEKASIEIKAEQAFTDENEAIWAFGYDGHINFENGSVIAESTSALSNKNYMTVLMEFPQGTFFTGDILDKSMADVKKEAFKGSDYDLETALGTGGGADSNTNGGGVLPKWVVFVVIPAVILLFGVPLILLIIYAIMHSIATKENRPKVYKKKYDGKYYPHHPANSLTDIYYIAYRIGKGNFENILEAFLLKWMKEEKIRLDDEEVGKLFKSDKPVMYFEEDRMAGRTREALLFNMLSRASDQDGKLTEKEMKAWASKNQKKITAWEERLRHASRDQLIQEGYIIVEDKKVMFSTVKVYNLTASGEEIEAHTHQFINYLSDYASLNEDEKIDILKWDELMVWSAFFGISKETQEQFEEIYPAYHTHSIYNFHAFHLASSLATSTNSSFQAASGGTGGGASSGGGGGSFGGGAGGGTR